MARFRLIPHRTTRGSITLEDTTPLEALAAAEDMSAERGCKVMVTELAENGTPKIITSVGKDPEKKARKAA